MVISITEALKKLEAKVGYKVGNGMCGSLASQLLEYVSGYSFDGEEAGANDDNSIEPFAPGADMTSSWSVYTTTDWAKIGYEYINNPTKEQLKAGDIFFISPTASGIWSGHSGIVLRVANGVVETLEQNIDSDGDGIGEQWVHKFYSNSGKGSWAWFKGFSGIVRQKTSSSSSGSINNSNRKEEEDMKIITIITDANYYGKTFKKGACFCINGMDIRYIERPQTLTNLEKLGVPRFSMTNVDLLYIIQDLGLNLIN